MLVAFWGPAARSVAASARGQVGEVVGPAQDRSLDRCVPVVWLARQAGS
ncbi:hypothetical protein HMPREF1979_00829 [Actinomyces johnsonii F0542]|uniref:Uncharacterized protein n=1 Tax=Actinomyces johnsonii F0542 TaxID=1321818 RepID=U1QU08_9ACTO|nr:hypothetical protein HMPREF1979_00829 [Actinomyces johnsonii F0542]